MLLVMAAWARVAHLPIVPTSVTADWTHVHVTVAARSKSDDIIIVEHASQHKNRQGAISIEYWGNVNKLHRIGWHSLGDGVSH